MSGQLAEEGVMGSMNQRFFRYTDHNSGLLSSSPQHPIPPPQPNKLFASFFQFLSVFRLLHEKASETLGDLRGSKTFVGFRKKKPTKKSWFQESIILDPQGTFLQKWNKIFLFSCVVAAAVDPLFFYIPVYDDKKNCLNLDKKLKIAACVLRTLTDLFYLLHIILKFRTGFISPLTRVMGRGELIRNPYAIAERYVFSSFWIDVLAVLPLPQLVILLDLQKMENTKGLLEIVIFTQYFPRLIRIFLLYKEVTRNSGIFAETAWAGAVFNLFLYIIASHVVGAFWYLFAIERQDTCLRRECGKLIGCNLHLLYCNYGGDGTSTSHQNNTFQACNVTMPADIKDFDHFNYGILYPAVNSIVKSRDFPQKILYCFWWGLRNLSSFGQNLQTSPYYGESLFSSFICIFGLVLFASLIGNMQKYLESTTVRVEEMRVRRRDTEQWMSHRLLPEILRGRIRSYEQYKWQETRGVDEEGLIRNLPKDLKRDIKRHLCLNLLMRVPLFKKMDEQLIDAMCHRLKPVLYTDKSSVVREGDPVDEMLFIMRGRLVTMTTNGGRTGFFNSVHLEEGDFCGEELLTWALDPRSSSNLPISTRTVLTITEVEAFALLPEDFKFVASQFRRRLHSKQLRHAFRFYSQQWRTWAACFIQAGWRQYWRRKQENVLRETENSKLQDALAKEGGSSLSLGATIYASRFAINALRSVCRSVERQPRRVQRLPSLLNLPKPAEPDFSFEEDLYKR